AQRGKGVADPRGRVGEGEVRAQGGGRRHHGVGREAGAGDGERRLDRAADDAGRVAHVTAGDPDDSSAPIVSATRTTAVPVPHQRQVTESTDSWSTASSSMCSSPPTVKWW